MHRREKRGRGSHGDMRDIVYVEQESQNPRILSYIGDAVKRFHNAIDSAFSLSICWCSTGESVASCSGVKPLTCSSRTLWWCSSRPPCLRLCGAAACGAAVAHPVALGMTYGLYADG